LTLIKKSSFYYFILLMDGRDKLTHRLAFYRLYAHLTEKGTLFIVCLGIKMKEFSELTHI